MRFASILTALAVTCSTVTVAKPIDTPTDLIERTTTPNLAQIEKQVAALIGNVDTTGAVAAIAQAIVSNPSPATAAQAVYNASFTYLPTPVPGNLTCFFGYVLTGKPTDIGKVVTGFPDGHVLLSRDLKQATLWVLDTIYQVRLGIKPATLLSRDSLGSQPVGPLETHYNPLAYQDLTTCAINKNILTCQTFDTADVMLSLGCELWLGEPRQDTTPVTIAVLPITCPTIPSH